MSFHLMRPEWLWALLPAVLLAGLLWRLRQRSGSWSSVIDPQLLPYLIGEGEGRRRRNLAPALLLAWALAVLAAAGPSLQKLPQPVHQKQDALVLVLDLSYSMVAADLAPSRVDRARQKLLDLLERRQEGQTGLIAYAGDAHIVTPLTDDTPTIANLLPALNPGMMPLMGSEPADALALGLDLLHSAGIRQGRLLLITDGISASDREEIRELLAGSGVSLAIMGVGSASGAPLPLPRGGFLKDESGAIVVPGLEEGELRSLATATGGRYMRMQIDDSDLDYLLAEGLLTYPQQTLVLDRAADAWEDQGYLLVLVLLPAVLALFRRGWIICLAPLLLVSLPQPAQAGFWDDLWLTPDQQGQRALQQGEAEQAAQLFADPDWAGTAAYRAGDYERAIQAFDSAEDADALYNRGNALARAGQLEAAMEAYRQSLQLQPGRQDAQDNLALLEQLQQQQQQQQDSGQEQEQNGQQEEQQSGNEQQQSPDGQQDQQQDAQSGQSPEPQQGQNQQDQQDQEQRDQQQGQQGQRADSDADEAQQQQAPGAEQQAEQDAAAQEEALNQAIAEAQQEDLERDQAMEQWLRRVPDDPSGLLRQKFRYQSQQRQQQGKTKDDDTYW